MSKLMINNQEYSGFSTGANNITYDNTTSKLSATTVQGAIDEVNNNLTELSDNTNITSSNQILFTSEVSNNQCFLTFLNADKNGFRVGFKSSGIWLQKMVNGVASTYLFSDH